MAASVSNGAKASRIFGAILIIAAPSLALGSWYSTKQPLEVLAQLEQLRARGSAVDSGAYASAMYHARHARQTQVDRWTLTGYATLGVIGTIVGAGLILLGSRRRTV